MNALDILRVLRRHPFVLALLLILSVAGAGVVYTKIPVSYRSSSSVILLPSKFVDVTGKVQVNPYRFTGDNPSQITTAALVATANGSRFKNGLLDKKVVSDPSVAVSPTGGGVVIDIAATDARSGVTTKDLRTILQALRDELYNSQQEAEAPSNQFYDLATVNPPDVPVRVTSGRFKTSAITGVLGVVISLIIILFYDAQARRRPRGRRRTTKSGRSRSALESDGDVADRAGATRTARRRGAERADQDTSGDRVGHGAAVTGRDVTSARGR